jgi:hypothetical protein
MFGMKIYSLTLVVSPRAMSTLNFALAVVIPGVAVVASVVVARVSVVSVIKIGTGHISETSRQASKDQLYPGKA